MADLVVKWHPNLQYVFPSSQNNHKSQRLGLCCHKYVTQMVSFKWILFLFVPLVLFSPKISLSKWCLVHWYQWRVIGFIFCYCPPCLNSKCSGSFCTAILRIDTWHIWTSLQQLYFSSSFSHIIDHMYIIPYQKLFCPSGLKTLDYMYRLRQRARVFLSG